MKEFITQTEEETKRVGEKIARHLKRGDRVGLYGELGAGKTTLVKGIARGLGIDEKEITSASFVMIAEYKGEIPLYHIDLYRVEKASDIDNLGIEEYLYSDGITVVEWADRFIERVFNVEVYIELLGDDKRRIRIKSSEKGLD